MNNLISNSTRHSNYADSALVTPRTSWRKTSSLFALAVMCAGCSLPASGRAMAATLENGASSAPYVKGAPRVAHGHPSTLWDSEDVAAYKASFATNPALKTAFDELRAWGDKRVTESLDVPAHHLEADGTWTYPDFKRGYQDASGKWNWEWDFNGRLQKRAEDVSNLGILYAFTGDEKYATFAKQILFAVADAYGFGKGSTAPDPHNYDHFEAYGFDGGDIAMFLAKACQGYDLTFNSTSLSAKDRSQIEHDLIRPLAEHLKKSSFMYTTHDRWGMVCLYGIFIAGETLNDPSLTDLALYGPGGTKDHLTGGFMDCFKPGFLHDAAVWGAGASIDDQMAALSVMTAVAEVMWHHGVDLYSYQGSALKQSFDAALKPLADADAAKLHSIPGVDSFPYAYRRYQDERYLSVIRQLTPGFTLAIGEHLPTPPVSGLSIK
jgi:hypothetical protein